MLIMWRGGKVCKKVLWKLGSLLSHTGTKFIHGRKSEGKFCAIYILLLLYLGLPGPWRKITKSQQELLLLLGFPQKWCPDVAAPHIAPISHWVPCRTWQPYKLSVSIELRNGAAGTRHPCLCFHNPFFKKRCSGRFRVRRIGFRN